MLIKYLLYIKKKKNTSILTVRDNPFLVLAVAFAGCAVVCMRIWVTVWAGLTVWTPIGVLSVGVTGVIVAVTAADDAGITGVVAVTKKKFK